MTQPGPDPDIYPPIDPTEPEPDDQDPFRRIHRRPCLPLRSSPSLVPITQTAFPLVVRLTVRQHGHRSISKDTVMS